MTHIMLDLETWGKIPGSDIRSIGACVFDPVAGLVSIPCETCKNGQGNITTWSGDCSDCLNTRMQSGYGDTFYVATDNPLINDPTGDDAYIRKYPLECDPETVQWWNDQTPEAQAAFANPVDLYHACNSFRLFIFENCAPEDVKTVRIWANDPHFDVSILDAVFRAVGLPTPWHYRSPRSMKTITEAAGMTSADYSNYGTAHNALDDAIAQAMTVCEAYKRLGLQK